MWFCYLFIYFIVAATLFSGVVLIALSKRSKFVLGGSGLTLLAAFALQCVAVSAAVHDTRT